MSNFNTNQWLEQAKAQTADGAIIRLDRRCKRCNYNLKGLRVGGVCPECGSAIESKRKEQRAQRKTLADAPVAYIRLLQLGYVAMGLAGLGLIPVAILGGLDLLAARAWMGLAVAGLWLGGLAILSAPRPKQAGGDAEHWSWRSLRIAALTTQSAWGILGVWSAADGGALPVDALLADGLLLVGVAGFVPTFWLIKRLADWAGDPNNGDRAFNAGIYLTTLVFLWILGLRLMMPLPVPNMQLMVGGVPLMALLFAVAYGYALLQILREAQSASWAVRKIHLDRARKARDAEQRQREWEAGETQREHEGFGGPIGPPPGSLFTVGKPQRARGHGGQDTLPRRW